MGDSTHGTGRIVYSGKENKAARIKDANIRSGVFASGWLSYRRPACDSTEIRIAYAETFCGFWFTCRAFMGNAGFSFQFSKWPFRFRNADRGNILDENEPYCLKNGIANIYSVGWFLKNQSWNALSV